MRSREVLLDVGRVLAGWAVLLALEHLVVGVAYRDEFAGAWELWPARIAAAPLFLGVGLFAAAACVLLARLFDAAAANRRARAGVLFLGAACGAAEGWGVSGGRHFATLPARTGLALVTAAVGMLAVYMLLALRERRLADPAPRRAVALVLLGVALAAWWLDAHALVRLYPAFHLALFAVSLAASGIAALDARVFGRTAARVALVVATLAALASPLEARKLRGYDNLRRVLVERAPWMGRAVLVGTWLSPPDALAAFAGTRVPGEIPRALDWAGQDIVLVSIDALRADHVGAYGYARPTTPHIDALARSGTLFRHAYCPTPHTSYSVTSMMTGKYMRPLLALGLGDDSETLASQLRRYGYRTAAFYPPAVFFIDEARFAGFEQRGLDFEYRKVEFADPTLREQQVREYLAGAGAGPGGAGGAAPASKPLFLWVHFFEPHEPYVQHPEHHFGDTDVDAYDSEIATADDGVGRIVALVRRERPGAAVIVTADHGEEFGDHGGRYHGTTVYEEQVRVPLVVSAPGVRAGATVDLPVQTIDILPTILSAQGIPRPARVRGRDLGPLLVRPPAPDDAGFAFAGTDDFMLLASKSLRLVCEKQADACTLFDVSTDAAEKHDVGSAHAAERASMRAELEGTARSHGRYEGQGADLPDALRRGASGDVSAALEVAGLLDDANVDFRRKAAAILFDLKSAQVIPQLRRAKDHDDDPLVRDTAALALARIDKSEPLDRVRALVVAAHPATATTAADAGASASAPSLDRLAALVLAERGDAAGAAVLQAWLGERGLEFARAREIVIALGTAKARSAVATLSALLDDVRLRAWVADALGAIGDASATPALLSHLQDERYVVVRPHEARALLALGVRGEPLLDPLRRFAGLPEPMEGVLQIAVDAALLTAGHSGTQTGVPQADLSVVVSEPKTRLEAPLRLGILVASPGPATAEVDGVAVSVVASAEGRGSGERLEQWADVPRQQPGHAAAARTLRVRAPGGVLALWLVPAAVELPPPPPDP